jgi:hypothetical protein
MGTVLFTSVMAEVRPPSPGPVAAVTGVVFDSLTMRGLSGATVQLVTVGGQAASRSTRSDAAGLFAFADVPVGSYLLGFFHPKLDSLGLTSETKRLDLRVDEPLQTRLTIPSGKTIAKNVCGASFVTEEFGLMLGFVRGVGNAMPRPEAKVSVKWAEVVIDNGSIRRVISSVDATSNATGQFAICGVPVGSSVLVQAAVAADSSGQFEVVVPANSFLSRDVFVGPINRLRVRSLDSLPDAELLRGTGRIRGKVMGANKRPVRDARVTVWGTGIQTTSNPDGEFSLAGLPGGTHTLEVRAIGFSPTQVPIDIMSGQSETADVELSAIAVTLDTVRVTAQRAYASRRLLELERRQRSGMGHILDAKEINKRNPWVLTDLLRSMPGIRMTPGRFSSHVVRMRHPKGFGFCTPEFIVDNVRVMVDEDFPIDNLIPMDDINAVEVYTNMVPGEYFNHNDCGVIAITSGGRPPPPPR